MMKKYLHTAIAVSVLLLGSINTFAAEEAQVAYKLQEQAEAEETEVVMDQENTEENQEEVAEKAPVEEVVEKVDKGQQVVDFALKYIGTPYVSGGNSLKSGVDCSGFVQQVYKEFDVNLERSSRSQYTSNGTSVKKADLKPGDLVFYGYSSVNHVGIYIGDGKIVHAPVPGKTVCVAPLWQRGDADIIGYKRIFE